MRVAYDGTDYAGWQVQPNGVTIEEKLNAALQELTGEEIRVIGASRTDAGVHSMGTVCIFDSGTRIPAEKISFALNERLPADIVVQESRAVPEDWHPRHAASKKTYLYRIVNRTFADPMLRRYAHFVHKPLDEKRMDKAAKYLLGEHDFKSFASIHGQAKTTVRTVYEAEVTRDEADVISFRITGDGFLYNMVRILAGTLLEIGAGFREPEDMQTILDARDRDAAGPTAPAAGLTMVCTVYDEEPGLWEALSN